ncbi:MAG TPA: hypothetical protein VFJ72_10635, partial [Rubrobacteraceae bacterium]|nr:hypothetical protein [Rubrobacteraceae bacterium]
MGQWVAAFVGGHARENYAFTRANGEFWVSSVRTPIRKARPGDRALLYMTGEGFVGEVEVVSGARAPSGEVRWTGDAALG